MHIRSLFLWFLWEKQIWNHYQIELDSQNCIGVHEIIAGTTKYQVKSNISFESVIQVELLAWKLKNCTVWIRDDSLFTQFLSNACLQDPTHPGKTCSLRHWNVPAEALQTWIQLPVKEKEIIRKVQLCESQ